MTTTHNTTEAAAPMPSTGPGGHRPGRRQILKVAGVGVAALGALSAAAPAATAAAETTGGEPAWDKTFPRSPRVNHRKVSFPNRLGITLVADLYTPQNARRTQPSRALVVGHPFGGVKEQTAGLYAQTMAERGFVTVAFDASYNGESGAGLPHAIASPEAFTEDFSAAVDYLGLHPLVDRNRIGVLGICGSGGFSLAAAQVDPRLKAVATVSMYDMGRATREGLGLAPVPGEVMTEEERVTAVEEAAEQRWVEAAGGQTVHGPGTALALTPSQEAAAQEFAQYYGTPRGQHPRSVPMSLTSRGALMGFCPFEHLDWIAPRPILLVHGQVAHSRYYSEDAYHRATGPKELYLVPGAGHVDLYDRVDMIPWNKLTSFFQHSL
ncbi:MAG TPA: alpha/beta hydrolase [Kocuria rosea]|jgi:fermentation-respiration switch protein FrsA (DUF1100 family)|nr:alpha/beta hydrolase [Kocuria rosea]